MEEALNAWEPIVEDVEPVVDGDATKIEGELIQGGKDGVMEMQTLGTTRPAGLFTYRLSGSGISSSATSFSLTSLTLPQNDYPIQDSDLSDTFYITFEPGSTSKQEFIACTTVGTNTGGSVSISGCTRGISPISPYTASSTLQFSHSGASAVIFSDPPSLFNEFLALQNSATSTGKHVWASTTPPGYDYVPVNHASGAIVSTTSEFASMAALQAVVASGCLDASTSNQGCVEIATAGEAGSSTPSGSQALLVVPASLASTTPQNCTSTPCMVMAYTGRLAQTWLNLAEAFTWTAGHVFSSTVNIAATAANRLTLNALQYAFPAAHNASSTVLMNGGSGVLSWDRVSDKLAIATTDVPLANGSTTVFTTTVPANFLGTNNAVRVRAYVDNFQINTGQTGRFALDYGGDTVAWIEIVNSGAQILGDGTVEGVLYAAGATNAQEGMLSMDFASSTAKFVASDTIAVDSTANQTLSVIFNLASGNGYTVKNVTAELIQ